MKINSTGGVGGDALNKPQGGSSDGDVFGEHLQDQLDQVDLGEEVENRIEQGAGVAESVAKNGPVSTPHYVHQVISAAPETSAVGSVSQADLKILNSITSSESDTDSIQKLFGPIAAAVAGA